MDPATPIEVRAEGTRGVSRAAYKLVGAFEVFGELARERHRLLLHDHISDRRRPLARRLLPALAAGGKRHESKRGERVTNK